MKKKHIVKAVLIIGFLLFLNYLESTACNKKGSIADKINWAGHNCPKSK
jgi:hypothetical protein